MGAERPSDCPGLTHKYYVIPVQHPEPMVFFLNAKNLFLSISFSLLFIILFVSYII